MIKNNVLIHLNKEYLTYKPLASKMEKLLNLSKEEELKVALNDLSKFKVNLNKKTLSVVIEGEEVYIQLFSFPNSVKYKIYEMINNELEYRLKNIDNIMFTYKVLSSSKDGMEVLVFCMNSSRLDVLKKILDKHMDIRAVYPIQICALNSCKKIIQENNYIFIFSHEDNLYFLACINNNLICNSVIENFQQYKFIDELSRFRDKCKSSGVHHNINKIYFLNTHYEEIKNSISPEFKCENLGGFNIYEIGAI